MWSIRHIDAVSLPYTPKCKCYVLHTMTLSCRKPHKGFFCNALFIVSNQQCRLLWVIFRSFILPETDVSLSVTCRVSFTCRFLLKSMPRWLTHFIDCSRLECFYGHKTCLQSYKHPESGGGVCYDLMRKTRELINQRTSYQWWSTVVAASGCRAASLQLGL